MREEGSDSWLDTFSLLTECTVEKFCNTTNYYEHLGGWSNSYINFQMKEGVEVEVKITRLYGEAVTKAVVHPREAARKVEVREGEVYLSLTRPALFTVDINGQMDDQDTGKLPDHSGFYDGPPIHTVTIFANPFLSAPSLEDPGVLQVSPGQEAPTEGPWHTLYFLPGLHDIGLDFLIKANRSYYISGEAVVYGTLSKDEKLEGNGENIHIYGHGTLSGDKIPHIQHSDSPPEDVWKYSPIRIRGRFHHSTHKKAFS